MQSLKIYSILQSRAHIFTHTDGNRQYLSAAIRQISDTCLHSRHVNSSCRLIDCLLMTKMLSNEQRHDGRRQQPKRCRPTASAGETYFMSSANCRVCERTLNNTIYSSFNDEIYGLYICLHHNQHVCVVYVLKCELKTFKYFFLIPAIPNFLLM